MHYEVEYIVVVSLVDMPEYLLWNKNHCILGILKKSCFMFFCTYGGNHCYSHHLDAFLLLIIEWK